MASKIWGLLILGGFVGCAAAQSGIYTCVDAKGRKITSDRPIPECNDRVQHELTSSGTIKRQIGPSLTLEERAVLEEQQRQQALEATRQQEERRRDRALTTRYPNKEAHDRARAEALAQIDQVIAAAQQRMAALQRERQKLDNEAEFYAADPARMPAMLKRQIEQNSENAQAQLRFIQAQEIETRRVVERFDVEAIRLHALWAQLPGGTAPGLRPASP